MGNAGLVDPAEFAAASGRGVRILIADSGVEVGHPDLPGLACPSWRAELTPTGGVALHEDRGRDLFGHGTAVAFVLRRYAPGAEISSVRVLGANLRGSSEVVMGAVRWGVRQGYDIVNCSFGTANRRFLESYKRLTDEAFCRNVWIVAACSNEDFRTEEYPAHFASVLSADFAALDGLSIERRRGHLVEFLAPGVDLVVPWLGGTRRVVTGSSFAAPHVAAAAARIRELRPDFNIHQAKAALYALADAGRGDA